MSINSVESIITSSPLPSPDSELSVQEKRDIMRQGRMNREVGGRTIVVFPGNDIQKALDSLNDSNGGTIILKAGTHKPGKNLTMYSNVRLMGETEGVILDFGNGAYGINALGSNAYTTGTLTATKGSSTITGSGTTWTAAMTGRKILIAGVWYVIVARASNTSITINIPFADTTAAGASYVIATTLDNIVITNLTIQNSTTNVISINYGNNVACGPLILINCTTGLSIQNTSDMLVNVVICVACGTGGNLNNCYNGFVTAFSILDSTSKGLVITSCQFIDFTSSNITNSTNNGVEITSSSYLTFTSFASRNNGVEGLECISGNSYIQFQNSAFTFNTNNGIKFTATTNNCDILNCQLVSNGIYGWNIANSNCNSNYAIQNHFSSNTSGNYSNSGTSTNISEGPLSTSVAGDALRASADTNDAVTASSYTKYKDISCPVSGTLRIKFDLVGNGGGTIFGQIYRNGVAVGTARSIVNTGTTTTFSEDISGWSAGDLIQLYSYRSAAVAMSVQNFRIYNNDWAINLN